MTPSPPFTPEQLLEHGRSLRALARGLLADESAAEDVVQEAWVVALERPPRHAERIGGWLHAVVRSLAHKRQRGEGRRRRREELAARPEGTASTMESAEAAALCKRLVDAVVALEEPYRTVVSMRYFEDLPPREIARRLSVPRNTVRSRLQRGLARLRADFDGDSEGERQRWAPALVAFAGLEHGIAALPAVEPAAGGALGVVTMTGVGKWVAAAAVVGLLGFGILEGLDELDDPLAPEPREAPAAAADDSLPSVVASAGDREGRSELAKRLPANVEGLAHPTTPPWSEAQRYPFEVRGHVVDPWERPVGHAEVYVAVAQQRLNRVRNTDENGRFTLRFLGSAPRLDVQLIVRRRESWNGGLRIVPVVSGEPAEVHLDLLDLGASGSPRGLRYPFSAIGYTPGLRQGSSAEVQFRSDSGVEVGLPEDVVMDFEESEGDPTLSAGSTPVRASLAGVVLRADGKPARSTLVGVKKDGAGYGTWASTGSGGEWRIDGLDPGAYTLQAGGSDLGLASAERTVRAGELSTWDAWLDRGREVRGRLLGPDRQPLAFHVQAEAMDPKSPWSDTTRAREDGRFAIPNAPAGPLRLLVFDLSETSWQVPLQVLEPLYADGVETELVLPSAALELAELSLSLRDEAGEPIPGGEVRLLHPTTGRGTFLVPAPTVEDPARYAARDLPAGVYRLEVGSRHRGWLDLGERELLAGQELELGGFTLPAPGLLVASSDPEDLRHAPHWQIVHLGQRVDSLAWEGWPLDAWEWAEVEAPGWARVQLPAGDYFLATRGENTGRAWFPFSIDSGGQTELELPLALLTDVTLRIERGPRATAAAELQVELVERESEAVVAQKKLAEGTLEWSLKLLPGAYHVRGSAAGEVLGNTTLEVEVGSGETLVLELR